MKKFIILAFLAFPLFAKSQINALGSSEDEIKSAIPSKLNAYFQKATYTDDGIRLLIFDFALNSELSLAAFYMNEQGKCFLCVYGFKDDSSMDRLVQSIKSSPGWEKIPDKFEYANYQQGYYIKFGRNEKIGGFTMAFNLIKKE
jgi:hypothetical protein